VYMVFSIFWVALFRLRVLWVVGVRSPLFKRYEAEALVMSEGFVTRGYCQESLNIGML